MFTEARDLKACSKRVAVDMNEERSFGYIFKVESIRLLKSISSLSERKGS